GDGEQQSSAEVTPPAHGTFHLLSLASNNIEEIYRRNPLCLPVFNREKMWDSGGVEKRPVAIRR
ncbi:MAG: hypothetical protein ABEJ71_00115, partial [Halodesulfurarchaeum sp.]